MTLKSNQGFNVNTKAVRDISDFEQIAFLSPFSVKSWSEKIMNMGIFLKKGRELSG